MILVLLALSQVNLIACEPITLTIATVASFASSQLLNYCLGVFGGWSANQIPGSDSLFDNVEREIASLETNILYQIKESNWQSIITTKLTSMSQLIRKIDSNSDYYRSNIMTYASNQKEYMAKLEKFIHRLETENSEYQLVQHLDSSFDHIDMSLVALLIAYLRHRNGGSRIICDTYRTIMSKVFKGYHLLKNCYKMKHKLAGKNSNDDVMLSKRLDDLNRKLGKSLRCALLNLKGSKDHISLEGPNKVSENLTTSDTL